MAGAAAVVCLLAALPTLPALSSPAADHIRQVSTAQGGAASLPCSTASQAPADAVRLVLWFKDSDATPVYSVDSRGR